MADKVNKKLASSLPVTVEKKAASSDPMADKVEKKLAPLLLVTVEKKKKNNNKDARLLWALLTAAVLVGSFAIGSALNPPWMMSPCDDGFMDDAGVADAEDVAIAEGRLTWCSGGRGGAGAAAPGAPPPGPRLRRARGRCHLPPHAGQGRRPLPRRPPGRTHLHLDDPGDHRDNLPRRRRRPLLRGSPRVLGRG